MTADLERIARKAGDDWDSTLQSDRDFLARFAALIAADCANLCSHMPSTASTPYDCADAIRERYGIPRGA